MTQHDSYNPSRPANLSREAQRLVDLELDRDWHDRAVRYGPEDAMDGALDFEPVSEERAALMEDAIRRYRAEHQAFCLAAEEMVARDDRRHLLAREAASLSSGTLATLTGFSRYDQVDAVQGLFVQWCQELPAERLARVLTWQEAWACFWEDATCVRGIVSGDDPSWLSRLQAAAVAVV